MGDSLKQDQFKFFYNTMKVIYDSALKDKLVATDNNVLETVLPELVAFKSLMIIRDIQLRKAMEAKKAAEKAAATGKPVKPVIEEEEEQDPTKMTETEIITKKLDSKAKGKDEAVPFEKSEEQKQREREEKER